MPQQIKGLYFILATALISGFSVFINKYAVKVFGDSDAFATGKNLVVALVLSALVLMPFLFNKIKNLNRGQWLKLVLIGLVGGSLPFLLFFKALSITSATSTAFIHKTLFIWVGLLAIWFLKERIGKLQYLALAILFLGNFALLGFKFIDLGYGELLALFATLLWAIEFVIAKKVLKEIPSEIVAWARMFFGSIVLIGFLVFSGKANILLSLNLEQFNWLLLTSALLIGYVLTWYKALKYLSAVTVASVLVLASPVTTFLDLLAGYKYNIYQIIGSLLIIFAVTLFILTFKKIYNKEVGNNISLVNENKGGEI